MILVFTWIQGSGKWTQARILSEKYGFKLLEMWQELRNIVASWSSLWLEIKEILESGKYVSPEIVWKVMEEVIWEQKNMDLILDGFIRNFWNKKSLEKIVPNYKVVLFELSVEKAKERLIWRMYDPQTWETFPSWTKINPKNWNTLTKRKDDNEIGILSRIDEFVKNTIPVIEADKAEWRIIEINANQDVEKVTEELIKKLGLI
jgi:adenylate kinase